MDYQTIYEHTYSGSDIIHLIPISLFVLFGILIIYYSKRKMNPNTMYNKILLFFGFFATLISSIIFIVFLVGIPGMIKWEREFKTMLEEKSYQIVEGSIENFEPPNESTHFESFTVKDIFFQYSDYADKNGFHKTSKKNGPITGNGQKVRIGYTEIDNENIILLLQIVK